MPGRTCLGGGKGRDQSGRGRGGQPRPAELEKERETARWRTGTGAGAGGLRERSAPEDQTRGSRFRDRKRSLVLGGIASRGRRTVEGPGAGIRFRDWEGAWGYRGERSLQGH